MESGLEYLDRAHPVTLPDCPRCDAAGTLKPVRSDYKGDVWAECSCCAKECLVKDGRVVYPVLSKTDISGRELHE